MGYKPVFQLAYKLQGPLRTVNRPELLWTLKPGKIFDIAVLVLSARGRLGKSRAPTFYVEIPLISQKLMDLES